MLLRRRTCSEAANRGRAPCVSVDFLDILHDSTQAGKGSRAFARTTQSSSGIGSTGRSLYTRRPHIQSAPIRINNGGRKSSDIDTPGLLKYEVLTCITLADVTAAL